MPLGRRDSRGDDMSELLTVGNYFDRNGAELAKSLLSVEGIESYVRADDAGGMRPFQLAGAGGVWLIVRAEDAIRASELLHALPQGGDSLEEDSPAAQSSAV